MERTALIRYLFCVAVAVVGAALADPLLEAASNAGLFGRGAYTDRSTIDVAPALCLGVLLAGLHLSVRLRHLLIRGWQRLSRGLQLRSDDFSAERLGALLPWIVATQLLVLYCMETAEQTVIAGHPLGGTVWLGAPTAISLAVHAATSVLLTFAAAAMLRRCLGAALRLAQYILRPISRVSDLLCSVIDPGRAPLATRGAAPMQCRIGERAPPFLCA